MKNTIIRNAPSAKKNYQICCCHCASTIVVRNGTYPRNDPRTDAEIRVQRYLCKSAECPWVSSHWMKLNGKRDNFTREDFYSLKKISPIFTKRKIDHIIEETTEHVSGWNDLAIEHSVPQSLIKAISINLRLNI